MHASLEMIFILKNKILICCSRYLFIDFNFAVNFEILHIKISLTLRPVTSIFRKAF